MTDILALDPGLTVGIAYVKDDVYRTQQIKPTEYPHPHETLYDVLSALQPKIVVYERFDFRAAKNGVVLKGVEYIGVIELYAQIKCIEVSSISPSDGKAFWKDNKLRVLEIYRSGLPHAMDAARILLTYRMRTDEIFKSEMFEKLRDM